MARGPRRALPRAYARLNKLDFVQFGLRGAIVPWRVRTLKEAEGASSEHDEVVVLSVMRNGMPWLHTFLAHHREYARFFWRDTFDYQGPLNLGNDREISVIDIARYVAKLFGGHPIVHAEPAPQDPTNRCPDLTIARQILPGWSCEVPFEEGVERTLEWFRAARLSNADTRAAQV